MGWLIVNFKGKVKWRMKEINVQALIFFYSLFLFLTHSADRVYLFGNHRHHVDCVCVAFTVSFPACALVSSEIQSSGQKKAQEKLVQFCAVYRQKPSEIWNDCATCLVSYSLCVRESESDWVCVFFFQLVHFQLIRSANLLTWLLFIMLKQWHQFTVSLDESEKKTNAFFFQTVSYFNRFETFFNGILYWKKKHTSPR